MADDTPRWKYRFDNYKRAFTLLREGIESGDESPLSQLEKEGLIQRFEYTMELAWKVMKDYLLSENVVFEQVTPRAIIRKAFEAKLVSDGQTWMDALDARNKMSHTYNFVEFEKVIEDIRKRYLAVMDELYAFLLEKTVNTE
jgi:nucleotidyltransferase substrate binding protein (TIGR01987 family)